MFELHIWKINNLPNNFPPPLPASYSPRRPPVFPLRYSKSDRVCVCDFFLNLHTYIHASDIELMRERIFKQTKNEKYKNIIIVSIYRSIRLEYV